MAELKGESEKVVEYRRQLEMLEERAEELDKARTNNISSIRFAFMLYHD